MPGLYLSFCHTSNSHLHEVKSLISFLQDHGGSVDSDIGDPFYDQAWHQQRLESADMILVICSSLYYSVVMQNVSPGKGLRWEGEMIRRALFTRDDLVEKSIPILLSNGKKQHVLTILKDKEILRFPDDQNRLLELVGLSSLTPEGENPEPKSVLEYLREGEIAPALHLLEQDPDHQNTDELILFQGRFALLTKEIEQGILSAEDRVLFYNRLLHDLLNYLDEDETN